MVLRSWSTDGIGCVMVRGSSCRLSSGQSLKTDGWTVGASVFIRLKWHAAVVRLCCSQKHTCTTQNKTQVSARNSEHSRNYLAFAGKRGEGKTEEEEEEESKNQISGHSSKSNWAANNLNSSALPFTKRANISRPCHEEARGLGQKTNDYKKKK